MQDRFGNPIDPVTGYAFGSILRDEPAFRTRLRQAQRLMRARATAGGQFHILTGNRADFPLQPDDLPIRAEGWVGPALFGPDLARRAREHVGAGERHAVELFNRTTAGVVAAVSALVEPGQVVVSLVPAGRAHPCVRLGARLAGAAVVEGRTLEVLEAELSGRTVGLAVITPVTSEQDFYDHATLETVARACSARGLRTLVDDAYGARVRPVLLRGPRTFDLPVDLAITNSDKAGLYGPRAGLLVGEAELVARVAARGQALALDAREPIGLGVLRALERYRPERLQQDAADGQALADALAARLGAEVVRRTVLGPTISEEAMLGLLLKRAGLRPERCAIVPAEAVAAVCLLLLAEHGIVTVNATSPSTARPSLRLKPTADALAALGGAEALAERVVAAMDQVAARLGEPAWIAQVLLGEEAEPSRR